MKGADMNVTTGQRIVVETERLARPARTGVVDQILDTERPRYRVQWDDGRTSILSPAAGSARFELVGSEQTINESSVLCRSVNERIRDLERTWTAEHDFICECADYGCTHVMRMDGLEFDTMRSDLERFAVLPGHELPDSDEVLIRTDRYLLVQPAERPA